MGVVVGFYM